MTYRRVANRERRRRYRIAIQEEAYYRVGRGNPYCTFHGEICGGGSIEIDHINSDGTEDRARRPGGNYGLYYSIIRGERSIDDLRLLCKWFNTLRRRDSNGLFRPKR